MIFFLQLQSFSASEKTETMKLLNEAVQLFRGSSSDQTYKQFQHQITGIRKILSQVRPAKDGKWCELLRIFHNKFPKISLTF